MRTVREYLENLRDKTNEETIKVRDKLINRAEEFKDVELTKEELYETYSSMITDVLRIYESGFNKCLEGVNDIDVTFEKRPLPKHLKR